MLARAPEAAVEPPLGAPGARLVDRLHGALVEAILDGRLDSAGRLYPGRIAARFGVSPTPAREALMRLAAEGVIRAVPRRGFHVRDPSPDEVRDLWQVRRGLETLAAELAVERLARGAASLDALEALERRLRGAEAMPGRDHLELNGRFHETLAGLAGNRLLATMFASIRLQLIGALIKRGRRAPGPRLAADVAEHRAIVAALKRRDAAAARAAVARHIDRSLADALADLAARAPGPDTAYTRENPSPKRRRR